MTAREGKLDAVAAELLDDRFLDTVPAPCATCAAVARHPHLRCDDHPFSGQRRPHAWQVS